MASSITLTQSDCVARVGVVEVQIGAQVPESEVVAFDVHLTGRVDESPLVEGDFAPFIRADRY